MLFMSNSDYYVSEDVLEILREGDMVVTISHPYAAHACSNSLGTH